MATSKPKQTINTLVPKTPITPQAPVIVVDEAKEHDPVPNKRGRKKNPNFMSYADAREFVQSEMIPSRSKFEEWWDRNKPKSIPRFPYRVYREFWISWNDFLGTDNKFNEKVGTKWRPMVDAAAYINTFKIPSFKEWLVWCKIPGNLPADIPARPDLVYNTWRSWNFWLGSTPVEAIKVQQEKALTQVFYIIHEQDLPENVFSIGIDPGGLTSMKERWMREKFHIVRMYWYDAERADTVHQLVSALSSPYMGIDRQRITVNVWELVWQLSNHLTEILKA